MKAIFLLLISVAALAQTDAGHEPFRIGIAGLTHTHVHWLFNSAKEYPRELRIVGIAEPNRELAERYLKQYDLSFDLIYPSLEEMIAATKPEAVTAFNSIFEHLEVVKKCAPKNIHVMVEKPLAVSLEHAREMKALASRHKIHILTNYETTWYASNLRAYSMVHDHNKIGAIRKIVVHDGHRGPKEIGVNAEFLSWLTDPVQNGGGALMDFGCYGANLITWLMKGQRPKSVFAVTQQIKPDVYPNVDDEATIVVTYPSMQGIIQASWNWPYDRKDMEVYGEFAYLKADRNSLVFRNGDQPEQVLDIDLLSPPFNDPFLYLAAVVRGEVEVSNTDLSALELNIIAMEILDAARRSARDGERVDLTGREGER